MSPLISPLVQVTSRPRDVQVVQIGVDTLALRSRTWDRLKFEMEYAQQRGTTANSYLIQGTQAALLDPPGESFTQIFFEELHEHQYYQRLHYVILSHVNANRMVTLKKLLDLAPYAVVICSKPAANTLRTAFSEYESRIQAVRDGEVLDLGNGHELQFLFVPTPRWPDALCIYDPATRILYTDKLFGTHVCDESVFDEHWKRISGDRSYYFDCIHAAQAVQVEAVLDQLAPLPAKLYAPAHGPMVRHSLSRFTLDYRQWCQQQQSQDITVILLYTSAYGNTGMLARAIQQGLTQAGATVESIDCEFTDPEVISQAIARCDGFVIGSPTLAGHAPTQLQTALGIVLSNAAKTKVAGVFGSYGWSGEAVDLIESKLQDAGYRLGFETIRVKFTPTEAQLQQCQTAGAEFVQVVKKAKKARPPRQVAVEAQTDRTSQAVGRVTGSLCVLTANIGASRIGFLTSWVSQASFNPPGITVAVPKDGIDETLVEPGAQFVINILKEGRNLRRHFVKPPVPGEDRFADVETAEAANGCPILTQALSYLECTVQNRMDCGDHWLLYTRVNSGKLLEPAGMTALGHRKSGNQY